MTRSNIPAFLLLAAAALLAAPLSAQVNTSKPIEVKKVKPQKVKFRGTVVSANTVQITVRSLENERILRTFKLSEKVHAEMQKIVDQGGYQSGDRVEIEYENGTDVAVKIKGKPSRP